LSDNVITEQSNEYSKLKGLALFSQVAGQRMSNRDFGYRIHVPYALLALDCVVKLVVLTRSYFVDAMGLYTSPKSISTEEQDRNRLKDMQKACVQTLSVGKRSFMIFPTVVRMLCLIRQQVKERINL